VTGCELSPPAALTLSATPHDAARARAFAQTHLCREHLRWSAPDVTLVVSELVTRALHAGVQPIRVELACTGAAARISVTDTADATDTADTREGGEEASLDPRLLVVSRVAATWGRETSGSGEPLLWCTIAPKDRELAEAAGTRPAPPPAPPWD
jgi:hypothetical protein